MSAKTTTVTVTESGAPYRHEISAGDHRFLADEPVDIGGGDTGPAPYDLLLAALGACTSMTLRMYANQKKWPVTGISVTLSHHKQEEAATGKKIDIITRDISISGDLDVAQRQRLLEIANKCPVHRTLESRTLGDQQARMKKEQDIDQMFFIAVLEERFTDAQNALQKGANVNITFEKKWTPLMWAIARGRDEAALFLIGKKADLNYQDGHGWAAAILAASKGNTRIVKVLATMGADLLKKTSDGKTACDIARAKGFLPLVQFLEEEMQQQRQKNLEAMITIPAGTPLISKFKIKKKPGGPVL